MEGHSVSDRLSMEDFVDRGCLVEAKRHLNLPGTRLSPRKDPQRHLSSSAK
jgi:hypothetical protein